MNRKHRIWNMIGLFVPIPFILFLVYDLVFSYGMMSDLGSYRPWSRRIDGFMIGCCIVLLVLLWIVFASAGNILRQRRIRMFYSVLTGREWVEISELAKVGRCKTHKAAKDVKWMIKKGYLPSAMLDEQKSLVLLEEHACQSYQRAWQEWQQKQIICERVGLKLEEQEYFLEGRRLTEEVDELASQIRHEEVRQYLELIAQTYGARFANAQNYMGSLPKLKRVQEEYLPRIRQMAENYLQMEQLTEDEEAAQKAGAILEALRKIFWDDSLINETSKTTAQTAWKVTK